MLAERLLGSNWHENHEKQKGREKTCEKSLRVDTEGYEKYNMEKVRGSGFPSGASRHDASVQEHVIELRPLGYGIHPFPFVIPRFAW